jgi:hypothetical protein
MDYAESFALVYDRLRLGADVSRSVGQWLFAGQARRRCMGIGGVLELVGDRS